MIRILPIMIKAQELAALVKLRQSLHAYPELSGQETGTRERVTDFIQDIAPEAKIVEAGKGFLAIFEGTAEGPATMIRAELDALPIQEVNDLSYKSTKAGISHKCGHDGHMCMVAGLAYALTEKPPAKGKVVLLFQSAEETGQGAQWMLEDSAFQALNPDCAFALHNLPGYPLHQVLLCEGTFCAASVGMKIALKGKTAHASHPEIGTSPAGALSRLAPLVTAIPQAEGAFTDFVLVTVTHMGLGAPTFGVSPGAGELWLTLRGHQDTDLAMLKHLIETEARRIAKEEALEVEFSYHEAFEATVNHSEALTQLKNAAEAAGLGIAALDAPNRWSEDFGLFLQQSQGAMFGLGAGIDQPALHNPDYDFPDELIETGIKVFWGVIQELNY